MFQSEFLPKRSAFRVTYDTNTTTGSAQKSKVLTIPEYVAFLEEVLAGSELSAKLYPFQQMPPEFLSARVNVEKWTGALAYTLPPKVFPIITKKGDRAMVSFPQTLWHIEVHNGTVSRMHVFNLFEPLGEHTMLYRLPLPNVYHDGAICIGGNQWSFTDFHDFQELVGRFFSAPHNGDLFSPDQYGTTDFTELLQILKRDGVKKERCVPVGEFGERHLAAFSEATKM